MKCNEINESLLDYLDKKLTPEQNAKIEAHMADCRQCRQELEELQSLQTKLHGALQAEEARVEPPPSAWDKLRRRLEPAPSAPRKNHGRFYFPVWQTATATVLVGVLVVGVLWGTGAFSSHDQRFDTKNVAGGTTPGEGTAAPGAVSPSLPILPGVQVSTLANSTSPYGASVALNLSLTNPSTSVVTLTSFPPEVDILPENNPKVPVRTYAAGGGQMSLAAGQSAPFSVTWDQKDASGQQVPAGWYIVNVVSEGSTTGAPQQTQAWVTQVYVMPPEGVLQKTVTINQTITVNGFSVTLEKIVFSDQGMQVYASSDVPATPTMTLVTPPASGAPSATQTVTLVPGLVSLPPMPVSPPAVTGGTVAASTGIASGTGGGSASSSSAVTAMPPILPPLANFAQAQYTIDGGAVEQAGTSTVTQVGSSLEHVWSGLHPVSKNAKQLTFTINMVGSQQGPWVFTVNLG